MLQITEYVVWLKYLWERWKELRQILSNQEEMIKMKGPYIFFTETRIWLDEKSIPCTKTNVYLRCSEATFTLDALKQWFINDETKINCRFTSVWRNLSKMSSRYRTIEKKQVLIKSHRLQKRQIEFRSENTVLKI